MGTNCLRCGIAFTPRKRGHVFCSNDCRHRGARGPHERSLIDHEAIDRLFDESRDPEARVRLDDWHPSAHLPDGPTCVELDAYDTLTGRRRWYQNLLDAEG